MIVIDWFYMLHALKNWGRNEEGTALIEAALLFPPMIAVLMGVFDLGNGILLGQKTITSSQIAADLTARDRTVNSAEVEEIINAARLAFEPFRLSQFGIDIVSVTFSATQQPVILWRVTRDMAPNNTAVASVNGLAPQGEGMLIVTVKYSYLPFFSNYFMGNFDFQEVAFARGRRSPTVIWE